MDYPACSRPTISRLERPRHDRQQTGGRDWVDANACDMGATCVYRRNNIFCFPAIAKPDDEVQRAWVRNPPGIQNYAWP